MKKFVMCSLAAVVGASLAGCGTSHDNPPGPALITANWSFKNFGGPTTSCPSGYDTVAIYSQPLDANGNDVGAPLIGDLFTCSDGTGTAMVDPGLYRIYLAVENHSGSMTWGDSASIVLDTTVDDKTVSYTLLNDGGYFYLSWDLVGAASGNILSCHDAIADTVKTTATLSGPGTILVDKFDCADHAGWTSGFAAGDYDIDVNATDAGVTIGAGLSVSRTMGTNNDQVSMGRMMIPVDGF